MINGIVSRQLIVKASNPSMLHWKRGSELKSSSIDTGQREKFVNRGAHRKSNHSKVIFDTYIFTIYHCSKVLWLQSDYITHDQYFRE